MKEIVLYSNNCPKCVIAKMKLKDKDIDFLEVADLEIVMSVAKERLFSTLPFMSIGKEWYYGSGVIEKIEEM